MIDNEVIQEVRRAREEVLNEYDGDLRKLMDGLIQDQKKRSNLIEAPVKERTLAEDTPTQPYNRKN